jgi:uncharacterized membrane protein YgcG
MFNKLLSLNKKMTSLNDLTPFLQGRIGDFLGPADRASMRLVSKQNNIIYDKRPRLALSIKQRLTMTDLQSGRQKSYRTPNSIVYVNQYSNEPGTVQQLQEFLNLANVKTPVFEGDYKSYGGWFESLWSRGDSQGLAFQVLTDFLAEDLEGAYRDGFREEWPIDNFWITNYMIKKAFKRNYSLFTGSELQNLIRSTFDGANRFPITFVKVREINLLDFAYFSENPPIPATTINEFVRFQHRVHTIPEEANDENIQLLLTRYLGGDEETSIDRLRDFARYRYTHEINVDLLTYQPPLLDSTAMAAAGEASAGEGASAGGRASSGGGASSGGEKRRREWERE